MLNYRVSESIRRLWEARQNSGSIRYFDDYSNGCRTYEQGAFRKYISCDIEGPRVVIPVLLKPYVEEAVYRLRSTRDESFAATALNTEIVHPIIEDIEAINKRTADSIIRSFFSNNTSRKTIVNVETNKGVKYSGGAGIILDEEGRVLFLATVVGNYQFRDRLKLIYTENRIYIHPKVMTDASDLMCKAILKKIIPYFLETRIITHTDYGASIISDNITNTVVVKDVGYMLTTPVEPPPNFVDDSLNDFLRDRTEDVIEASRL